MYVPPADIENYQERREALGNRYAKAYLVLRADSWVHAVVDGALLLGHEVKYLHTGPARSADHKMRRRALKKGLGWLSEHFRIGGEARQRRRAGRQAQRMVQRPPTPARPRGGVPSARSPDPAAVTAAATRLRGRANPP
jgi:hypothetical protein